MATFLSQSGYDAFLKKMKVGRNGEVKYLFVPLYIWVLMQDHVQH